MSTKKKVMDIFVKYNSQSILDEYYNKRNRMEV